MAVNKVVYGGETLIDISDSTVTPETLGKGVIAYNKAGEKITGSLTVESSGGGSDSFYELLLCRPLDRDVELTIPNGVKHIGQNAISGWYRKNIIYGLKKINLNEVETIEQQAFQNNNLLIEVNAPNLTMLSYDCFFNAINIPKLYFPNVIRADNGNSFRDCQVLKVVEFDKMETLVGNNFVRCYKLDTLIIRTPKVCTLKSIIPNTNTCFYDGTASIYVPDDLVEGYKTATNWVTHSSLIKPLSEYVEV